MLQVLARETASLLTTRATRLAAARPPANVPFQLDPSHVNPRLFCPPLICPPQSEASDR